MGIMPKKVATAVVFLIAWQATTIFGGFSAIKQPRKPVRPARARIQDILIATAGEPSVQEFWKAFMTAIGGLQKGIVLFNGYNTAAATWEEWSKTPKYTQDGDITKHASDLVLSLKDYMKINNNVMISRTQLPKKPIRGTYIEQLLVSVLCEDVPGMVTIHAESGAGKSVAVLLAALEVGRGRRSDYYVVLQNDLNQRLCGFFRVSEASLVADIVDDFFLALQEEKIQLHLVFDNVLDSGATSDIVKDQLKALARSAFKWGHQVLFTMQEKQAAESVADLNGATTRMTKLQNNSFGAYRWRQNEAEELIKTFADEINMTEVLAETEIPDEIGQWRPREIESFMRYGAQPLAPQRRMQAGWAAFTSYLKKIQTPQTKNKTASPSRTLQMIVWVRQMAAVVVVVVVPVDTSLSPRFSNQKNLRPIFQSDCATCKAHWHLFGCDNSGRTMPLGTN